MDNILVKHNLSHARGTRVAGAAGRQYLVHPATGLLHLATGRGAGDYDSEPGCHPDDAQELLAFKVSFAPGVARIKPPPPPPRPTALAGGEGGSVAGPTSNGSPAPSVLALGAVSGALPPVQAGADALSTTEWLKAAHGAGIDLTRAEKQTKPKAALAALIRERAEAMDAAAVAGG
jgi:hypothetical protein